MTEWTAGYVSDVEYLPGFYREQSPVHLDLACLIGGVQPPDRIGGMTYCELGCGTGLTTLLLAAANPAGRFVGIDFNPAHIARGKAMLQAAGLANVELIEAAFADLLEPGAPGLPQFDYVTLHGVYSWISAENRRAIVKFLANHVKPGGLVYVSYNAMPGWMMGLPLQRLMLEFAGLNPGRSDRLAEQALAFVAAMQKAGARAIPDKEIVERLEREISSGKLAYVAHEYLNQNWHPLYHADVARELAEAKLAYVASATMLENYPELALSREQTDLLNQVPDDIVRESLRDYFMARAFRRDIFIRGSRRLTAGRREAILSDMPLGLFVPPAKTKLEIAVPVGEAKLEERLYGPALEALTHGVLTPQEILSLPAIKGKTNGTATELVGMLLGSGQAVALPAMGASGATARAFNRAALAHAGDDGQTKTALAAPFSASGIHAGLFEMLAYRALAAGAPAEIEGMVDAAWKYLAARGDTLRKDGKPIENAEDNRAVLRQELTAVLADTVPIWRRLGVI
jgi:SAM-dependent methyltransferase